MPAGRQFGKGKGLAKAVLLTASRFAMSDLKLSSLYTVSMKVKAIQSFFGFLDRLI